MFKFYQTSVRNAKYGRKDSISKVQCMEGIPQVQDQVLAAWRQLELLEFLSGRLLHES